MLTLFVISPANSDSPRESSNRVSRPTLQRRDDSRDADVRVAVSGDVMVRDLKTQRDQKTADPDPSSERARRAFFLARSYDQKGDWENASRWYFTALQWNPENCDAARGFVSCCFRNGRHSEAFETGQKASGLTSFRILFAVFEAVRCEVRRLVESQQYSAAKQLLSRFPRDCSEFKAIADYLEASQNRTAKPNLLADATHDHPLARKNRQDALVLTAGQAFESGNYSSVIWNLSQAAEQGRLPRKALIMRGWSLFHVGRYEEASRLFERLYNTQADSETAEGIVASLRHSGREQRLLGLASDWGGILAEKTGVAATPPPAERRQNGDQERIFY